MKFSEAWLREWADPKVDTKTLTEQLTMAGLEVDSVTKVANDFSGVVVGHVLAVEQHPNADRLRVCQVDVGGADQLTIVCGAANVRTNLKVAVAVIGAKLSPDFILKTTKLRGVVSQGMICSAEELGLAENSEGILELADDASIGIDFRHYLNLADQIIDVDLTPNRGDCLSVFGIAREVAAINKLNVPQFPAWQVSPTIDTTFPIQILAKEDCPQYVGRVIAGISMNTPTPIWLKERLRRSGVRSIHVAVDVTNYVMLELGQPLHAFDLDKLQGQILVRRGTKGESLTLLDGRAVFVNEETLVIADEKGPLALAGIMGGLSSAITKDTQHIFLESAFFNPLIISGRARSFGLSTDASHRFERFVCPNLQTIAMERATQLLLEIAGGEAGPLVTVQDESYLPKPSTILLRSAALERLLGIKLAKNEIENLLQRLNMQLQAVAEGWQVTVPLYRFDVRAEVDLIEEVARLYGYERIMPKALAVSTQPILQPNYAVRTKITSFLQSRGYQEAITYSFVDPSVQRLFDPEQTQLTLENPISSELSVMRASLWPGLLQAVAYNQSYQRGRVRLFEIGLRFKNDLPRGPVTCDTPSCSQAARDGGLVSGATPRQNPESASFAKPERERVGEVRQELVVAGVITGARYPEQWGCDDVPVDFFDMKADLAGLFTLFGRSNVFTFCQGHHVALHPGQTAEINYQDQLVGYLGALHPKWVQQLELEAPVYLFEILLSSFSQTKSRYIALSKFPAIRRDLAVVVEQTIPAIDLLNKIRAIGGAYLIDAWIFDVYQGEGILPFKKSLAVGLIWQHLERTLLDEEVNTAMQEIILGLQTGFNAVLRE